MAPAAGNDEIYPRAKKMNLRSRLAGREAFQGWPEQVKFIELYAQAEAFLFKY